jgi:LysR family transcriptional regulator, nod-box dependent transcriptional activator
MHLGGLDLNLLMVLDALFVEKNVTRAGERIHLSQSATSGALARLREYFKDDLLVHVGRKMVLTPLAEELAQPVRELLQHAEAVIRRTPVFSPESSERKFRIVMSDYIAIVLMTRALPQIQRNAPGITLQIMPLRTDALEQGDADLAILPQQILAKDHPSEVLFQDEFVCIACAKNKLIGSSLSSREYLSLSHVAVRFGEQLEVPSLEEEYLGTFGQKRRIEVVTSGFTLLPHLILGTTRIATIQRRLAEFYARQMPLKIVRMPKPLPRLEESMQWHAFRNADPGLLWLRRTLKEFAKQA